MELVGRDDDLDAILVTLRTTQGVLIFGAAGVGKSALAAAAAARLSEPPVARIVATAAGRSVPLSALGALLPHDHTGGAAALAAVRIAERLAEDRGPRRIRHPPVLLVDDVHELDEASAAVLLSLVLSDAVRLLGTVRTGQSTSDAVTALWKERLVRRIDLRPLDQTQAGALLTTILGGPVASPTVSALHELSSGNPLHLTELARFGRARDRFVQMAGRWWWLPESDVPPRLGELLMTRVTALTDQARDAAEILALGEPLPFEALAAICESSALDELDRAGLIVGDEPDGVLRLRFSHPLIQSVTEASISTTRRRTLCRRLQQAPADHVDVVRQAAWQLAGGGVPRVDILLAAADALITTDSKAAERLAQRAATIDEGSAAMVTLAHIQAERGDVDATRATMSAAAGRVADDEQRMAYHMEELSESLWLTRDAAAAMASIDRMRAELPASFDADIDSSRSLVLLFTGRTAEALEQAECVLAAGPGSSARIRALTTRLAALCFADRGAAAMSVVDELENELRTATLSATRTGLIQALLATTRAFHTRVWATPRAVGALGRWPSPAGGEPAGPTADEVGWPLLVGMRRHLAGDLEGALDPLREAVVQQLAGEGVFRSEAVAELVVVCCELGRVDEAEQLLQTTPPDAVAIVPGLADWAAAALASANWRRESATDLAVRAAEVAFRNGAELMAWTFLSDAARWGDPRRAARARRELAVEPSSHVGQARAAGIDARAADRPGDLVRAADLQLRIGLNRHAIELAELARASNDRTVTRSASAVLAAAYARLGTAPARESRSIRLTTRESEIAYLAARGHPDREIADRLVLSVRTVHSHLASAYRKLGVSSRAELSGALNLAQDPDGPPGP